MPIKRLFDTAKTSAETIRKIDSRVLLITTLSPLFVRAIVHRAGSDEARSVILVVGILCVIASCMFSGVFSGRYGKTKGISRIVKR